MVVAFGRRGAVQALQVVVQGFQVTTQALQVVVKTLQVVAQAPRQRAGDLPRAAISLAICGQASGLPARAKWGGRRYGGRTQPHLSGTLRVKAAAQGTILLGDRGGVNTTHPIAPPRRPSFPNRARSYYPKPPLLPSPRSQLADPIARPCSENDLASARNPYDDRRHFHPIGEASRLIANYPSPSPPRPLSVSYRSRRRAREAGLTCTTRGTETHRARKHRVELAFSAPSGAQETPSVKPLCNSVSLWCMFCLCHFDNAGGFA